MEHLYNVMEKMVCVKKRRGLRRRSSISRTKFFEEAGG
jgi:hypothetical protein